MTICVIKELNDTYDTRTVNCRQRTTKNREHDKLYVVTFYVRESDYMNSELVIEYDDHKHKTPTDESLA